MLKRRATPAPRVKVTHKKKVKHSHRIPKEPEIWIAVDNTCVPSLSGGIGNKLFQICFAIGYAMKHGIKYFIPTTVRSPHPNAVTLYIQSTGVEQNRITHFQEIRDADGFPIVQDLPLLQNPVFSGYWQHFGYFNFCREEVLKALNFPSEIKYGLTSIHMRRGDAVHQTENFPMLLQQYYTDAIKHMNEKGNYNFYVYSDDAPFAKTWFTKENYPQCTFEFQDGGTDYDNIVSSSNCENHILARSTFGYMGAWLCQNENKIVLCPPFPLFKSCHREMNPPEWIVIDTPINTSNPNAQWVMQKKIQVSFEPLPNKIKLDNVTLLCVATRKVEASASALLYSCKGIDFAEVHLVSPYRPKNYPDKYKWTYVESFADISQWNHHIYFFLWKYFTTSHCILIHDDGWICHPEIWRDEWLQYDFIGSPYSAAFAEIIRGERNQPLARVGNSVSLRSRKLCKMPTELGTEWRMIDGNYNEDVRLSIHFRTEFEKAGAKFAPLEEAIFFGRETEFEENAHIEETFLFHKYRGKNAKYPKF